VNKKTPFRKRLLLIDSSLLMLPVSGRRKKYINIENALFLVSEGMQLAVLDSTIEELEIIQSKKIGKKKLAADFALELIKRMKIPILKVDDDIREEVKKKAKELRKWEISDEILARMAKRLNAAVATTDLELKEKLRKMGIPVLYLRGKKWLLFEPQVY